MPPEFSSEQYKNLVKSFQAEGYQFRKFELVADNMRRDKNEEQPHNEAYVILRHDIDLGLEPALEMGRIEAQLDVQSTYFVQLRSSLYNVLSAHSSRCIRELHELGHDIALHFDFQHYDDKFDLNLLKEIDILAAFYPFLNQQIVSIHKFGSDVQKLQNIALPNGIRHTYEQAYFGDIEYFSDSTGKWRYGNPVNSAAFNKRMSMQLLIHPVWWMCASNDDQPLGRLKAFMEMRRQLTVDYIQDTTVTFSVEQLRR